MEKYVASCGHIAVNCICLSVRVCLYSALPTHLISVLVLQVDIVKYRNDLVSFIMTGEVKTADILINPDKIYSQLHLSYPTYS